MPPRPLHHAALVWAGVGGLLVHLVVTAGPAGAHSGAGGSLPAPSWLLAYIGAFAIGCTALALRTSWARVRWAEAGDGTASLPVAARTPDRATVLRVGQAVGTLVYVGVVVVAIGGPATPGANLAPYAVFVIWWVGLPVLCLLAGDVMRAVNPFVLPRDLAERALGSWVPRERPAPPRWTAGALLFAFSWFFLAYHRAGSPRMLAVLLLAYAVAAVAGGVVWGRGWLDTGEGFAALSRGVSQVSLRRRLPAPPGLLLLVVVWVGGTLYDGISSTEFWIDVQGTSTGWSWTALNTVGLAWMIAVVGAVALAVLRIAVPPDEDEGSPGALLAVLGLAVVPLALAWFLAHDFTYLIFESQNFWALLSDPLGKGWDLFGTIDHMPSYSIVTARWVRWVQLGLLLAGHVAAVVIAHDGALAVLGRRRGMRATWAVSGAVGLSVVGAALLVLR